MERQPLGEPGNKLWKAFPDLWACRSGVLLEAGKCSTGGPSRPCRLRSPSADSSVGSRFDSESAHHYAPWWLVIALLLGKGQ
jgi:hypothetical protein